MPIAVPLRKALADSPRLNDTVTAMAELTERY
jgi:hypothetical protein